MKKYRLPCFRPIVFSGLVAAAVTVVEGSPVAVDPVGTGPSLVEGVAGPAPSEEPVSVFGARGEPSRFREKDRPGGPYAPRLDLSSLFGSTPEDSVDTRTSWDIAKEIMLWTGVVAVIAFFIVKVFINPNSGNDDGSDSDGGKPLPQSSLLSLLSLSF